MKMEVLRFKITIPSDMSIIMYWKAYEEPSYDMTEFVRVDSLDLNFEFTENKDFIHYH